MQPNTTAEDELEEIPLSRRDVRKEVKKESPYFDSIGAFLLAHTYLEAFMRETFVYSHFEQLNRHQREKLLKDAQKNLPFSSLQLYFLSNGTLRHRDYVRIKNLNRFRNRIAHHLLDYEIHSKSFKENLKEQVFTSLSYCTSFQIRYAAILKSLSENP